MRALLNILRQNDPFENISLSIDQRLAKTVELEMRAADWTPEELPPDTTPLMRAAFWAAFVLMRDDPEEVKAGHMKRYDQELGNLEANFLKRIEDLKTELRKNNPNLE